MIYRPNIFLPILMLLLPAKSSPRRWNNKETYMEERAMMISEDFSRMLGSDLILTMKEERVSEFLAQVKAEEMEDHFITAEFPPAESFFKSKSEINKSKVYSFIKDMPKGAALHIHDKATASIEWVISELTYWKDLYMCTSKGGRTLFKFFDQPDAECEWRLVRDLRSNYSSPKDFDEMLVKKLSIITQDPLEYDNINSVWKRFSDAFKAITGIVTFLPAFEKYIERGLKDYMEDNINYIELRSSIKPLYLKNGTNFSQVQSTEVYQRVCKNFSSNNSKRFFKAKVIYSRSKRANLETVWHHARKMVELKSLFPDFIAGFDLVGPEQLSHSLLDLLDPLLFLANQNPQIKFFFHAGETSWHGISTDENLFDAILLNVSRIGHAYAASKHPAIMEKIRDERIPVEVCPISSQVLMLVEDLRNHPLVGAFANGFPLIISSDDSAMWGSDPLSHDFYQAFMAFGGARADLKFLKKLAMNSIEFSSLNKHEKHMLYQMWTRDWNNFIDAALRANNLEIQMQQELEDSLTSGQTRISFLLTCTLLICTSFLHLFQYH